MITVSNTYFIITLIMSIWLVFWFMYRLLKPMECNCGFSTHFIWRFKRHILMKHQWK